MSARGAFEVDAHRTRTRELVELECDACLQLVAATNLGRVARRREAEMEDSRRIGSYSYDLLDNAASPSADRILPEHEQRSMLWAKPHSTRRPVRYAYATLAAALAASAVMVVVVWDAAWWPAVAFALAPDLAVLYGIAPGLARGQLHPRAAPLYNALHRFWGPLALAVVVLAAGLPLGYLAAALAWAAHVAFDRAIGLRLRTRDGFQRGGQRMTELLEI